MFLLKPTINTLLHTTIVNFLSVTFCLFWGPNRRWDSSSEAEDILWCSWYPHWTWPLLNRTGSLRLPVYITEITLQLQLLSYGLITAKVIIETKLPLTKCGLIKWPAPFTSRKKVSLWRAGSHNLTKSGCPSSVSREITLNAYSSCSWQSITIFHPLIFIIFHCFTCILFIWLRAEARERGSEGGREGGYLPVCVSQTFKTILLLFCVFDSSHEEMQNAIVCHPSCSWS